MSPSYLLPSYLRLDMRYRLYTCIYCQIRNSVNQTHWCIYSHKLSLPPNFPCGHDCRLPSVFEGLLRIERSSRLLSETTLKKWPMKSCILQMPLLGDLIKDKFLFYGKRIGDTWCQSQGTYGEPSLRELETDSIQLCFLDVAGIFFKLLFYCSSPDGTFPTLKFGFKGTWCTWICVGVSFFILHV